MISVTHKPRTGHLTNSGRSNTLFNDRQNLLPEIQVLPTFTDRPATKYGNFKTSFCPPREGDVFGRSQVTSVPVIYRQTKKLSRSSEKTPRSVTSCPTSRSEKNEKVLSRISPGLSSNQCRFFSKWTKDCLPMCKIEGSPATTNRDIHTHYRQHSKSTGDAVSRTARLTNRKLQLLQLPNIHSPLPSTKRRYVMKWLSSDSDTRSSYYHSQMGDVRLDSGDRLTFPNKVFLTTLSDGGHLTSPFIFNAKIT